MIIYIYLLKRFLLGVFVSITVLVSIEIFFSFTAELKYLNHGNYDMLTIIKYTVLNLPKSIEIMYPYAILIGSMLSLGAMASDHEFIAMQAAGISVIKVMSIVIVQAFIISCIFYIISDSIVPEYSSQAEQKKNIALNKKIVFHKNGIWLKDKKKFIKIDEVYSDKNLKGITLYKYDSNNKLFSITYIKDATYKDKSWHLYEINETFVQNNPVKKDYNKYIKSREFIDQKLINIKTQKSTNLSLLNVIQNIQYLDTNGLDNSIQKKIFWEKIFKPISTVIMLFLSMPFIFGRHRTTNASKRLILGLFIGIGFFITTSILPNLGIVFGIIPFLNVLLPNIIFIILGRYLLDYHLEAGLR